jgi:hypothetical protein
MPSDLSPTDRRRHPRFAIPVTIRLYGTKADGTSFQETTSTESVSAGGFGCRCLADLPNGTLVEVIVVAGRTERLLGSACIVGTQTSASPWRRYNFALMGNVDEGWFLIPDDSEEQPEN